MQRAMIFMDAPDKVRWLKPFSHDLAEQLRVELSMWDHWAPAVMAVRFRTGAPLKEYLGSVVWRAGVLWWVPANGAERELGAVKRVPSVTPDPPCLDYVMGENTRPYLEI